jgi:CRP-like cAMP-binding protein
VSDIAAQGHRDNRLLAAMPPDAFALLERDLDQVSLKHGAALLEPGEPIGTVYFPQSGLISLTVVIRNGSSLETSIIGREGALGLQTAFGIRRSPTRATAQIGGNFSTIGAERFERIVNDITSLRDLILRHTEMLLAEAHQIAACNALHSGSARLCRWLLQSADRVGRDEVPLTQEYLAQMLGVRRTTVTLLAQGLQGGGLIKYKRGHIVILDRAGLEASACECYDRMRHEKLTHGLGLNL